jgi:monoterpene epsilon-lactone hydrolase
MTRITTVTPLETVQKLIADMMVQIAGASLGLEANRQAFDEQGASIALPDGMQLKTVQIAADITGDMLTPLNSKDRAILYFHGGGYLTGSALSHRPLCARIANQSRCKLLSVNYRLAPENKYPVAVNDALDSYSWLLTQGYSPAQVVFAGDSAGGGLVMAALLSILQNTGGRDLPMPAGAVGLSPWLDLNCSSQSYRDNGHIDQLASAQGLQAMGLGYIGDTSATNPLVSPFYADDLKGICPLLLQVGSVETLHDEVAAFADRALKDGASVDLQVWDNMIHVWHSFADILPESELAIQAIAHWLERH